MSDRVYVSHVPHRIHRDVRVGLIGLLYLLIARVGSWDQVGLVSQRIVGAAMAEASFEKNKSVFHYKFKNLAQIDSQLNCCLFYLRRRRIETFLQIAVKRALSDSDPKGACIIIEFEQNLKKHLDSSERLQDNFISLLLKKSHDRLYKPRVQEKSLDGRVYSLILSLARTANNLHTVNPYFLFPFILKKINKLVKKSPSDQEVENSLVINR